MSRGRVVLLIVSIIILTIFFVIFTVIRHRAAKRLARVTAVKERMEGELSGEDNESGMFVTLFLGLAVNSTCYRTCSSAKKNELTAE